MNCGCVQESQVHPRAIRMTKSIARYPVFRQRVFEAERIEMRVYWHITYRLSSRHLVAMLAERGFVLGLTTPFGRPRRVTKVRRFSSRRCHCDFTRRRSIESIGACSRPREPGASPAPRARGRMSSRPSLR